MSNYNIHHTSVFGWRFFPDKIYGVKPKVIYSGYIPYIYQIYLCILRVLDSWLNYLTSKDAAATTPQSLHVQIITEAGGHVLLRNSICLIYVWYILGILILHTLPVIGSFVCLVCTWNRLCQIRLHHVFTNPLEGLGPTFQV